MLFIVAEIGVNWDGDLDLAEKMTHMAKQIGFDAVKFQAFNAEIVANHKQNQRLMKNSITHNNVELIDNLCKKVGIEWFCTPMYPEAVTFLDPFVKRYKIREIDGRVLLDNKSSPTIEKVLNTGKEVIVSSQKSPIKSKYYKHEKIKWLYCVPKYPSKIQDHDFRDLKSFNGFSNHCTNFVIPLTAFILGSEIIEIHITLDKNRDFIDNDVSYDFSEASKLIDLIKQLKKIIEF